MAGPFDEVHRAEGDLDSLRRDMGRLVSELDRRRKELLDVRGQLRKHPRVVIGAAAGAVLVLGGLVALAVESRRRRARPKTRARETRRALARLLDHPDRVAAEPSMGAKIATAAGVAAGSVVARRVAERIVARAIPRR